MDVVTEPRPAVVRFAQLMERKLRERDYKGGWENCTLSYLVGGITDEVVELVDAMDAILTDDGPTNLHAIIEEAVDVANYCMMLADVAQAQIRRKEERAVRLVKVWEEEYDSLPERDGP